jgi:hypothetical protein
LDLTIQVVLEFGDRSTDLHEGGDAIELVDPGLVQALD